MAFSLLLIFVFLFSFLSFSWALESDSFAFSLALQLAVLFLNTERSRALDVANYEIWGREHQDGSGLSNFRCVWVSAKVAKRQTEKAPIG